MITDEQIIDQCRISLELHNSEIEEQVKNLTLAEHKIATKKVSQQAFKCLLNRFQKPLKI